MLLHQFSSFLIMIITVICFLSAQSTGLTIRDNSYENYVNNPKNSDYSTTIAKGYESSSDNSYDLTVQSTTAKAIATTPEEFMSTELGQETSDDPTTKLSDAITSISAITSKVYT